MKIYKIAMDINKIPPGQMIIRTRISPDGTFKREIVHAKGEACEEGEDQLLQRIFGVEGVVDGGKTLQHYQTQQKNKKLPAKPVAVKPEEEEEEDIPGTKMPTRKLDVGGMGI